MKKLAAWLGIVALALHAAWPLLATAKPKSVALVPLCTSDGVTHYLEVPTARTPLEESSGHGGHCPLCYLGHAMPALSGDVPPLIGLRTAGDRPIPVLQGCAPLPIPAGGEARAPPPLLAAE